MTVQDGRFPAFVTPVFRALCAAAALTAVAFTPAHAEINIDITRGTVEPLPIAVVDFIEDVAPPPPGQQPSAPRFGMDIAQVINVDLERSGIFRNVDRAAFLQQELSMTVKPQFSDWRILGAQALVHGAVKYPAPGQIRVEFRLWDVFSERQMIGQAFTTEAGNWRRVSHMIADMIYARLTGESGYFDSRIVYVAESGPKDNRVRRLAIMDQDGANHKYLTDGRNMVLTPRFSPRRQEITYLSYVNMQPRVYLFNIQTGRQELLGNFNGMTFAPRFSPDGDAVVMSHADRGNSDIYVMDLRTRQPKRLTFDPAIDTSPSFSPDGKRVVFTSDRGGTPQLYVMDADGGGVRRISFNQGRYSTPVWSPRGDLIAFTRQNGGRFYIGVMHPDGSGERLLSESFLEESPTWSPNGRVLLFFRQFAGAAGRARLYSVDLTGGNLREIVTPGDASDPAWSPLNAF